MALYIIPICGEAVCKHKIIISNPAIPMAPTRSPYKLNIENIKPMSPSRRASNKRFWTAWPTKNANRKIIITVAIILLALWCTGPGKSGTLVHKAPRLISKPIGNALKYKLTRDGITMPAVVFKPSLTNLPFIKFLYVCTWSKIYENSWYYLLILLR